MLKINLFLRYWRLVICVLSRPRMPEVNDENNQDRPIKKAVFLCFFLLTLSASSSLAVTTSEVPTAITFGMPIGGTVSSDLSKLSISTYPNGYPKIRFNDDADNAGDSEEWYVGTAHNETEYITSIWDGSKALYDTNYAHHPGEDWNLTTGGSTDSGRPIYSIANGIVVLNDTNYYGNTIIIVHRTRSGEYITSFYGHMQSPSSLAEGTFVRQGQQIGSVGDSGAHNQYHLHFEIRKQSMLTISNGTISRPAYIWPASSYPSDKGQSYINDNYYNPSTFLKNYHQIPLSGDWDGNNTATTGVFKKGSSFNLDNGQTIDFGIPGDIPIIGDWDGDGIDEIGLFRPKEDSPNLSTFYLDLDNNGGAADRTVNFGYYPFAIPIVGDWDGNGYDDIGVFNPSNNTFYLYLLNNTSTATFYKSVALGSTGDYPIAGDWNGDGKVDIGVFRQGDSTNTFYLDLDLTGGAAEHSYTLGNVGDIPIIGNWDGDGDANIGIYRPSTGEFVKDSNIPNIAVDAASPTITAFSVTPASLTQGNTFTISYTVANTGGSGLNRVELWRAIDIGGTPGTFSEITRKALSGGGPLSDSFSDAPSSSGTYWYGLHVVDNTGNWNDEKNSRTGGSPGIFGPSKVTVTVLDIVMGDFNGDKFVNLKDAILTLQILSGISPAVAVKKEADLNRDSKIGIEDTIYILQSIAGVRSTTLSNPTLSVSPSSGQQGASFTYTGSLYTPSGIVEWHVKKPDGTEYPAADLTGKVDGSGNFSHVYVSGCASPTGVYTIWAFDKTTGRRSNDVSETITASASCNPTFTNGQLLRDGNDYYVYNQGKAFKIPNATTFEALGYNWNIYTPVTLNQISSILGPAIPDTPWGGLIRAQIGDEQRVYIAWQGRHHIPDGSTATDIRGSSWNSYINVGPNGTTNSWAAEQINAIPLSSAITATSSWGSAHNFNGCLPSQLDKNNCGWCTNFVASKRKVPWSGNAKDWMNNAASWGSYQFFTGNKRPVPGAIMVLSVGTYGHVAFVESVSSNSFVISEMNWGSDPNNDGITVNYGIPTSRTLTIGSVSNLVGFIY